MRASRRVRTGEGLTQFSVRWLRLNDCRIHGSGAEGVRAAACGEFADYAKPDIDLVVGDDAVEILAAQEQGTLAFWRPWMKTESQG